MKSKKRFNTDGSTRLITVRHDSGAYISYTPIQAARMINELRAQLWGGIPMDNNFKQMRG